MKSTRSSTFWLRSYLIWQTEPKIQRLVFIDWGLLMTTPARADCEDIPPVGNRATIHFHPESILPVESEASFKVTWLPMTNHRPVLPSRDLYWPMTGQYSGHVTVINQWQASIQVTWLLLTNDKPPPWPPVSWCCTSPAWSPGPGYSREDGGRNYQQLKKKNLEDGLQKLLS